MAHEQLCGVTGDESAEVKGGGFRGCSASSGIGIGGIAHAVTCYSYERKGPHFTSTGCAVCIVCRKGKRGVETARRSQT